jgi:mRNA-degrading endonuclease RelE of RelBE toxin-antitoxin system
MFEVLSILPFKKDLKRLAKKYPSLLQDVKDLIESLEINPIQGESLGQDSYKIRLKIASKNRGKSGGGRVITCVKIVAETVHLLSIYDKSEKEDLEQGELDELLKQIDL